MHVTFQSQFDSDTMAFADNNSNGSPIKQKTAAWQLRLSYCLISVTILQDKILLLFQNESEAKRRQSIKHRKMNLIIAKILMKVSITRIICLLKAYQHQYTGGLILYRICCHCLTQVGKYFTSRKPPVSLLMSQQAEFVISVTVAVAMSKYLSCDHCKTVQKLLRNIE